MEYLTIEPIFSQLKQFFHIFFKIKLIHVARRKLQNIRNRIIQTYIEGRKVKEITELY